MTVDRQTPDLQGFTSIGTITEETAVSGVQHLYKATVTIKHKGTGFDASAGGRRFICLSAFERYVLLNKCLKVCDLCCFSSSCLFPYLYPRNLYCGRVYCFHVVRPYVRPSFCPSARTQ